VACKLKMLAPQKSTDGKDGAGSEESEGGKTSIDSTDYSYTGGGRGDENRQDDEDVQESGVVLPHGGYFYHDKPLTCAARGYWMDNAAPSLVLHALTGYQQMRLPWSS
jgi:hypothetical protein